MKDLKKELSQLFENKSNCYADVTNEEVVLAMTKDRFIEVVEPLLSEAEKRGYEKYDSQFKNFGKVIEQSSKESIKRIRAEALQEAIGVVTKYLVYDFPTVEEREFNAELRNIITELEKLKEK